MESTHSQTPCSSATQRSFVLSFHEGHAGAGGKRKVLAKLVRYILIIYNSYGLSGRFGMLERELVGVADDAGEVLLDKF